MKRRESGNDLSCEAIAAAKVRTRRRAVALRKAAARQGVEDEACNRLFGLICSWSPDNMIAAYLPIKSEISPVRTMNRLVAFGYRLCLPVVRANASPLEFRRWRPGCKLERGRFNTVHPRDGAPERPAVLIVPLLGFDRLGSRLGYGGGYYDRTIAGLARAGGVFAIGFSYAKQEFDVIPCDENDRRMDAIVTETETIMISETSIPAIWNRGKVS